MYNKRYARTDKIANKVHNVSSDVQLISKDFPMNGKLFTSVDGSLIGFSDYSVLTNFEYTDAGIKAIAGMTKINTAAPTYLKHRNIFQFNKTNPDENHVLTQSYNANTNSSVIQQMTQDVPSTGTFDGTAVYTVASTWAANTAYAAGDKVFPTTHNDYYYECSDDGTSHATTEPTWPTTEFSSVADGTCRWVCKKGELLGNFSKAPDGCMAYCNGNDVLIWGGDNYRVAKFINYDPSGAFFYDLSERASNSSVESNSISLIKAAADTHSYVYICSMMPISGINWKVSVPNTTTCAAPIINYWNGSDWASVGTVTDGTLSGGKTLAQSGTMAFNSTENVSKQSMLSNIMGYWYRVVFDTLDSTTSVYYVTLKTPMQKLHDIWDGSERTCISLQMYTNSTGYYTDYTTNIAKMDAMTYYDGSAWIYPPETYANLGGFTPSDILYIGFVERQTGIRFSLPHDQVNVNSAAMSIYYWNGAAWTTVGTVDDQTKEPAAAKTLNNSGYVVWNQIAADSEFRTTVSTDTELYYYKIVFNAALSADVKIDFVSGMAAQTHIGSYNAPVMWMNMLWLVGQNSGERNRIRSSAVNTMCVFNGSQSNDIYIGTNEEVIAGCSLFSRFLQNVEETMVLFKKDEVWVLDGSNPENIVPYKVSSQYGITSARTLAVCDIGVEVTPGVNKAVAIWQSSAGIMMFDNGALITISNDIDNYFEDMYDTSVTERINPSAIDKSVGFYDPHKKCYHWLFAAGASTTLNREYVYDIIRKKWYRIDRGTGLYLQSGGYVLDINGATYLYGSIDTGYIERLDYGNTFDGSSIVSTFRMADKPLDDTMWTESNLRHVKIVGTTKDSTGTFTLYYYPDQATTGTSIGTVEQSESGKRAYHRTIGVNKNAVFHGIGGSITSNDTFSSCEPLAISYMYHNIRYQLNRRS